MIEVNITKTANIFGSKESFTSFDSEQKQFGNIKEAKQWLKETYGKCKKQKMFVDTKKGEAKHVGYIYCFRNADLSHYSINKWYQQDWVEIIEVNYNRITI